MSRSHKLFKCGGRIFNYWRLFFLPVHPPFTCNEREKNSHKLFLRHHSFPSLLFSGCSFYLQFTRIHDLDFSARCLLLSFSTHFSSTIYHFLSRFRLLLKFLWPYYWPNSNVRQKQPSAPQYLRRRHNVGNNLQFWLRLPSSKYTYCKAQRECFFNSVSENTLFELEEGELHVYAVILRIKYGEVKLVENFQNTMINEESVFGEIRVNYVSEKRCLLS